MRVLDKIKICLCAGLLFLACSNDQDKKVASGYTEEQNAGRLDPVLAERLKTWEPEVPVDSTKRSVTIDTLTFSWYEIEFMTQPETYFQYGDTASEFCTVKIYGQENGVRLDMRLSETAYVYTEILMRDSAKAIAVDRLDNTYGEDENESCAKDFTAFSEECEDNGGTFDDSTRFAPCTVLHLVCTRKFTPQVNAGLFLKSTAAELQKRCEDKFAPAQGDTSGTGNKTTAWDSVLTDERDGKTYKAIVVGDLNWMAENLNYDAGSASACYDDDESNCEKYGRLYTWDSLICPTGWRLPTVEEYRALEELAEEDISRLKSTSDWENPGTDEFGLNFLPGGMCRPQDDSTYHGMGQNVCLWTGDYMGMPFAVNIDNMGDLWTQSKATFLYVRCVQD